MKDTKAAKFDLANLREGLKKLLIRLVKARATPQRFLGDQKVYQVDLAEAGEAPTYPAGEQMTPVEIQMVTVNGDEITLFTDSVDTSLEEFGADDLVNLCERVERLPR
jgi:hypothetical protein